MIMQEIYNKLDEQIKDGYTNGFEKNTLSVDLNGDYDLFVYVEKDDLGEKYHTIQIVDCISTNTIETACADFNSEDLFKQVNELINKYI